MWQDPPPPDGKTLLCLISLQNTTTTRPPHCSSTRQCNPTRDQVLPLFLDDFGALLRSWLLTSNIEDQGHDSSSSSAKKMGFKKVDPSRWEFASEGFLRGQKHLLKTLKRRRAPSDLPSQQQSSAQLLEVGHFGDGEIDQLRCDKSILLVELVKLRQEQQNMRACIMAMEDRLQDTEQKQQQIMAFLARALPNPNFLHQLAERKDRSSLRKIFRRRGDVLCIKVLLLVLEGAAMVGN